MYLCISCMNEISEENKESCPFCGFSRSSYRAGDGLLLPESIFDERYYIGRAYNGDRYGISYLVYDTVMKRKAVLRQLFSSGAPWEGDGEGDFSRHRLCQTFVESYQRLAGLKLSSLPKVYTCRPYEKWAYAVTGYVSSETLADKIAAGGAMDYEEAKSLMLPVLTALAVLHGHGLAHGSLTPRTIFMSERTPVVCDISGVALDRRTEAYDIRHFLQIFLSVMCGSPEMIHMKSMPQSFFENNALGLPDDVLNVMSGIMQGTDPHPDACAVLRVIYGTDRLAPQPPPPSPKPPPRELVDLAAQKSVAVTRLITSI